MITDSAEIKEPYTAHTRFNGEAFGRVAVMFGGTSAERDISLQSGQAILEALNRKGVDAFGLVLDDQPCDQILSEKFDRAFIALHGVGGEDGKIQALLDLMHIPYTGSDHAACALAMNKLHTKQVWQAWGLPTPPYIALGDSVALQSVLDTLGHVFVKPVHEGSSFGISSAQSVKELLKAKLNAEKFDSLVMAEKLIYGEEYSVAILGGKVLTPIQIKMASDFYDFDAKYVADSTEYICPSALTSQEESILRNLAWRAFDSIGCRDWGRVDFMRNTSGEFFLLEVNTVPGMTSHSLVPIAANDMGLDFDALTLEILSLSMARG